MAAEISKTASPKFADAPIKPITTPKKSNPEKTDIFAIAASGMCLGHNTIIRGFNSVYLQAPHIEERDKADFVGYATAWHSSVHHHHTDEEAYLFPIVEEILNDKSIWDEALEEHKAFHEGLEEYHKYLTNLPSPSSFSGAELVRIMDTFMSPFEKHFRHEITTIAAFHTHPNAPAEGTTEAAAAHGRMAAWGRSTGTRAPLFETAPFFLLNTDRTAEDGLWKDWPPIPAPVRWAVINVVGARHGGWWRFASCDGQGTPRELYALRDK